MTTEFVILSTTRSIHTDTDRFHWLSISWWTKLIITFVKANNNGFLFFVFFLWNGQNSYAYCFMLNCALKTWLSAFETGRILLIIDNQDAERIRVGLLLRRVVWCLTLAVAARIIIPAYWRERHFPMIRWLRRRIHTYSWRTDRRWLVWVPTATLTALDAERGSLAAHSHIAVPWRLFVRGVSRPIESSWVWVFARVWLSLADPLSSRY